MPFTLYPMRTPFTPPSRLLALLLVLAPLAAVAQSVKVEGLRCEYQNNPLGTDVTQPRLSWRLASGGRNVTQTAYEIRVAADAEALSKGQNLTWQTGKVASDQSVHVPYGGPAPESRKRYYWQVRAWDGAGKATPWSEARYWEMGLLQPADWTAAWILAGSPEDTINQPAQLFRKSFALSKPVKSARAYATAHGLYELFLNGKRVGDWQLTPGWTSYNKRLQYQTYDVTSLLRQGDNAAGAMLGNGWFRGSLAWENNRNLYGKKLALLLQLEITYADGTRETVGTDGTWKSTNDGPVRYSEIYNGETYDARMEKAGWTTAGFDDGGWAAARPADLDKKVLVAQYGPPVRKKEVFKALKVFKTLEGETVVDFGQNLVGWVQLRVKGKAGDKVTLHHAEVLDKRGNFYTENLRAAKQEIGYTLRGGAEETYEPHFTFQGFRYVRVNGYPGELRPEHLTAVAVYSDMEPTGTFASSHPLLNQLQHNIQWGQKGNFVDVPTDCPQRDERLGWTGDAQVFARTAAHNMLVGGFFTKWLRDVAADQTEAGSVPFVVPNVLGPGANGSAGWADAATIIPWQMYLAYGDKRLLETQYPSMKAWVGYVESKSKDYLWNSGFHFGDWLFYRPDDDNDGRAALTDKYLIAQAFFAHSTDLMIKTATVLGKTDDVQKYTALLDKVKKAFLREYLTPSGRLVSGSQTAYVLALHFDLLPEDLRPQAAARLVENIKSYDHHLTTGFLGTPYLCHVLTRFGHADVAYKLLMQETYPSWLYPVKMGATTIWERWDGIKPDSTFQTPSMNSYNHYAYGAIGDWMYRSIAGIDTYAAAPGYKQIRVAPLPGGGLTQAGAGLETLYGLVKSDWKTENGRLRLTVTIPANTTADVILPGAGAAAVTEGGTELSKVKTLKGVAREGDHLKVSVGSGTYQFEYPWQPKKELSIK